MILTIGTNCSTIRITSELIDDFIESAPSPIAKLTLTGTINCCEEEFKVNLTPSLLALGYYSVTPSFFNQAGPTLLDGIYKFVLKADFGTLTNIIRTDKETACTFVSCETLCELVKTTNDVAHLYFYVLDKADQCECVCDEMCTLYEQLLKLLNATNTVCS